MNYIKDKYGNIVYCIRDNGTITDKFDCNVVAHIKEDRITDKFSINTLYRIRKDGTITDKYDCNTIGHIREDGKITDKYDIDVYGNIAFPYSSHSSNSFLGSILSLISAILMFIIFVIVPFVFIYVLIPVLSGMTWLYWIIIPFAATGIIPATIILGVIVIIFQNAFYPYWIMLIIYRAKKQITTKKMLSLYWKWFLKGPLAYKDIITLRNEIRNN